MGLVRTATASTLLCFLLASCNTTDALTPQVDVGDSSMPGPSSPVTQMDTARLAAAPVQPVYSSDTQDSYRSTYNQQAYQGSSSSTLDSQADAMRNGGSNPEASRPLRDQQAQYSGGSDDQADTGPSEQQEADRRLNEDPGAAQPRQQAQTTDDADRQDAPQQQDQASLPPAAASGDGSIRFLPIIGAPVQAVTPLSRQLGAEARAQGLTIKGSNDNSTSYILKGYLSAFQDGPAISVTYVWDVLDNGGNRLHRIQGNESVPLKGGDPWQSVPPSVMQKIADKTIAEFTSWRATRGG